MQHGMAPIFAVLLVLLLASPLWLGFVATATQPHKTERAAQIGERVGKVQRCRDKRPVPEPDDHGGCAAQHPTAEPAACRAPA